jgi:hypothetical protein
MRKYFLFLLLIDVCSLHAQKPAFKPQPNYNNQQHWIALPQRHDIVDTIPPGCTIADGQSSAKADVFYVHPTLYFAKSPSNASLSDTKLNNRMNECTMHQASAFNNCAKIYAPRYRQAHIAAFKDENGAGKPALDTAYADVRKAFIYYLENWNNGGPIILAGHSQGAYHLRRLLKEFFDGKPLQKQLVAAYAIGYDIREKDFQSIPPCDSATHIGCFITWNTVEHGQDTAGAYKRYLGSVCVNPLTWTRLSGNVTGSLQKGALRFDFKSTVMNLKTVEIHGPLLWVTFKKKGKKKFFHLGKNFHVSDMNLFWMDIRINAALRVERFMQKA